MGEEGGGMALMHIQTIHSKCHPCFDGGPKFHSIMRDVNRLIGSFFFKKKKQSNCDCPIQQWWAQVVHALWPHLLKIWTIQKMHLSMFTYIGPTFSWPSPPLDWSGHKKGDRIPLCFENFESFAQQGATLSTSKPSNQIVIHSLMEDTQNFAPLWEILTVRLEASKKNKRNLIRIVQSNRGELKLYICNLSTPFEYPNHSKEAVAYV